MLLARSLSKLSNKRIARKASVFVGPWRQNLLLQYDLLKWYASLINSWNVLLCETLLVVQLAAFEDTWDGSDGVVVFAGLGKRKLQPSSSYICKILPQDQIFKICVERSERVIEGENTTKLYWPRKLHKLGSMSLCSCCKRRTPGSAVLAAQCRVYCFAC